jgi:aquaporin related protein
VFWTGGSLNPARSLAPAIVTRSFPTYHWIYWVGPTAGTVIAVLLYKLIKALEYETAQDDEEEILPALPTKAPAPDNSPTVALSNVKVESQHTSQPATSSHLAPPQPTYAKVPYVQDKESEKSGGLPTCTGD